MCVLLGTYLNTEYKESQGQSSSNLSNLEGVSFFLFFVLMKKTNEFKSKESKKVNKRGRKYGIKKKTFLCEHT